MPIDLERLRANIKEYIEMGEIAYKQRKYNASLILYFKALVGICDYIIKRDLNEEPDNHTHRFRILREHYHDLYRVVDKFFSFYRDTYQTTVRKREVEGLRDAVLQLTDRIE
ncbi:hypothetical protein GBV73_09890 [Thermococcus sp. 101 C5]|uniref:hypothetical protein n=1 Tax=Thermococcus sp. 101 C5 TaxID=2654197 RepID=UPI00128C09C3|nr:hypothetical protein [Thermococcus sp. 101 C5]MPW39964.1 hypothetical protein [Thermococcus sp. 101 C5]